MCWVVVFSDVEPFVEQFELFSLRVPPIVFACFDIKGMYFWVVGGLPFCVSVAGVLGLVGLVGWLG